MGDEVREATEAHRGDLENFAFTVGEMIATGGF